MLPPNEAEAAGEEAAVALVAEAAAVALSGRVAVPALVEELAAGLVSAVGSVDPAA